MGSLPLIFVRDGGPMTPSLELPVTGYGVGTGAGAGGAGVLQTLGAEGTVW